MTAIDAGTITLIQGKCFKCKGKGYILETNKLCIKCAGRMAVERIKKEKQK